MHGQGVNMETAVIKNEYDGPAKPQRKTAAGQFSLDFAYSQNAHVVDNGIRETIRGVKISIMAMGIALYRVDVSGLFIDLGFKKFGEYIDSLAEDTGMVRTTLYNWEYMGEAYIKNRAELERVGFSDDDGPSKLPYLSRALEHYPKRDVFRNIKDMSKREFEDWSRGQPAKPKKYKAVRVKKNGVYAGTQPLVTFADGVSPKDRRYYEGLIMQGALAVRNNQYAKVFLFYDETEARNFDRFYQRELKALRAKK
jgi:hypothetical protein